jgi:hypothetical protein
MHQHTQLNSFIDPQEVSIEVQQRLEAKKSQKQLNYMHRLNQYFWKRSILELPDQKARVFLFLIALTR